METLLSLLGLADGSEVEEGGGEEKEACAEFRRTSPPQSVGRRGRTRSLLHLMIELHRELHI